MRSEKFNNNEPADGRNPELPGTGSRLPAESKGTDKNLIRERFETAFEQYDALADVQKDICKTLISELESIGADGIRRGLEIGAGTGFLTRDLFRMFPHAQWYVNDLVTAAEKFIGRYSQGISVEWLWGDGETVCYPVNLDLIASSCTIQWFSDLPAFAKKAAQATNKGGWLALTTFGEDNFHEIRATTGEGLRYRSTGDLKEIFESAGYEVFLMRSWKETLLFDGPSSVLKHIKATGVNSVKKTSWGHDRFTKFETDYRRMFSAPEGGVTLTFNPVIIVARLR